MNGSDFSSPSAPPPPSAPTGRITLGVLSDTHGWVHPFLHEAFAGVTAILHAGDVGDENVLSELGTIAPTLAVRGNMDGGPLVDLPSERVETFGRHRVAMLHIAGSPSRPTPQAQALVARAEPQVLLYGHSHIPAVERARGVLFCNPGAAGRQGIHRDRSALRLHLDPDGRIHLDLIKLGARTAPG